MSESPPLSLLVRHFLLLVMTSSLLYAEAAVKPCGTTIHSGNRITSRIVNGNKADIFDNPWMVQIEMTKKESQCGGSIINSDYVLTAAHCLWENGKPIKASSVTVATGEAGWSIVSRQPVEKIFVHKDYNSYNRENDIALIKLKYPVKSGDPRKNSICLPTKDVRKSLSSLTCKVAGWGAKKTNGTASVDLMEVNLNIVGRTKCSAYIFYEYWPKGLSPTRLLCATAPNKDTCDGDSGGPLICQNKEDKSWFVAGIVSFGNTAGCNVKGHYGIYVQVSKYLDWIKNIAGTTNVLTQ